jgi:hypothetical protein
MSAYNMRKTGGPKVLGQMVVSSGAHIVHSATKAPAARYFLSVYFWLSV